MTPILGFSWSPRKSMSKSSGAVSRRLMDNYAVKLLLFLLLPKLWDANERTRRRNKSESRAKPFQNGGVRPCTAGCVPFLVPFMTTVSEVCRSWPLQKQTRLDTAPCYHILLRHPPLLTLLAVPIHCWSTQGICILYGPAPIEKSRAHG